MSELYNKLKEARMQAMRDKEKAKKNTLTTLIGDIETQAKTGVMVDDAYVTKQLKKAIETAQANYEYANESSFLEEKTILENFLPQQMSEQDLENEIDKIIQSMDNANIGSVMKTLKEKFNGLYDGKTASKMVKEKV